MDIIVNSNLAELPNTTFIVVIHYVWDDNNDIINSNQLQGMYTELRLLKNFIDFIKIQTVSKFQCCLTVIWMSLKE